MLTMEQHLDLFVPVAGRTDVEGGSGVDPTQGRDENGETDRYPQTNSKSIGKQRGDQLLNLLSRT